MGFLYYYIIFTSYLSGIIVISGYIDLMTTLYGPVDYRNNDTVYRRILFPLLGIILGPIFWMFFAILIILSFCFLRKRTIRL